MGGNEQRFNIRIKIPNWNCGCFFSFSVFVYFSFSPQPPERTQMFVTSRLLEMGFSMRHIYWAMEAAGTAL